MKIPFFHVDAFTRTLFRGNPAIVMLLSQTISDEQMQAIAYENNLPASVFLLKVADGYLIRWFTLEESDLCGHGSLAAAYVVFNFLEPDLTQVKFTSKKGLELLIHQARDGAIVLAFPQKNPRPTTMPEQIAQAFAETPQDFSAYGNERCLIVMENEQQVRAATPDLTLLTALPWWGYVLTAPGRDVDFVSRTFYPGKKVMTEDHVTGASHCLLAPYWGRRLNKTCLTAKQVSARGGVLSCELTADQVMISSHAVFFANGELHL